jgi:glucan phosphoethanolaminetransferase (alkaline phosphatase superfamily)
MLFPVMFIGAFQIVVSYLYHDGSPIGVDMFLNVWTTNLTEVDELLSSLVLPVALVVVLYLPLTVGCRRGVAQAPAGSP